MWASAGPPTLCWCRAWCVLLGDVDAHRPRGAGDDLLGGIEVVGVEVGHLLLGDLAHLRAGERADLLLVRDAEPLSRPAALRISLAAGGVLVMKVNERSS